MSRRTWYPAHDAELTRLFGLGHSNLKISLIMGRTGGSIKARLQLLRLMPPVDRIRWTPDLDARLRRMHEERASNGVIAEAFGATVSSISARKNKLQLVREALSEEMVDRICELTESGMSRIQVASALDLPGSTVDYYIRKEGALNSRSRTSRSRSFDSELLELEAQGLTYSQIGQRLGKTHRQVRCRLITLARRDQVIEANGLQAAYSEVEAESRKRKVVVQRPTRHIRHQEGLSLVEKITQMVGEGTGPTRISAQLSIPISVVEYHMRRDRMVGPKTRFHFKPREIDEAILELAGKGLGSCRIGKQIGISNRIVENRLTTRRRYQAGGMFPQGVAA